MKWWERLIRYFERGIEEEDLELEWDGASIENWDWETLLRDRDGLNIRNERERKKFIRGCVEQMNTSSLQLDSLTEEYNMVTGYLKDMEEIEALPENEAGLVRESAKKIVAFEGARKEYLEKKNRLDDKQFQRMANIEEAMPKPYEDIREAEKYRELIRADMNRLEGEKHAYCYRRQELQKDIANAKGMVAICLAAALLCTLMLLILQFGFDMETRLGHILTLGCAAVAITVLYVKYLDYTVQLSRTESGINRIVLLKNTVNIRYVNNTNLLDYLYTKYQVDSGRQLHFLWEKYQQEKEERIRNLKNIGELEQQKKELIRLLRQYPLHDPLVWVHQPQALLDKKEMVEIRHGLVERRQKLRAQMDYNKRLATQAQQQLKEAATDYPRYREEILQAVEGG